MLAISAIPVLAQQTGSIQGKVTDSGGAVLPGVTVEARSDVLPGPRVTVTGGDGSYQLPALPPGQYVLTFTLSGMQTATKKVNVQLSEITAADAALGVGGLTETVTVTADATIVDKTSAAITSGISNDQIKMVPVGQEYRDLIKLIPGVQYTQDSTRGPSSGSSGQDNVYKFDGVNVTLPLFGTLSAEPAAYDIAQVTVIKGGAKAIDFIRAGGFAIDSVSKSGTSSFAGQVSYQFQNHGMSDGLKNGTLSRFQQNRSWAEANIGGPVIKDRLFFFGSYYRPEVNRENRANVYGDLPRYESTRNEGFGKLTLTPTHATLLNASYRDSKRLDKSALFGQFTAPTAGTGNESRQKIGTADGSWVINAMSYLNFKYTHFTLLTAGIPDNTANVNISTAVGTRLDVANLDKLGTLSVPSFITGADAYNAFITPIVSRYGFNNSGVQSGGSTVGFGSTFDRDNFFRDSGEIGYNLTLSGLSMRHNVHVGYQQSVDSEDLTRSSNGWGSISVPGGRTNFQGTPIFYAAAFQQQGVGAVPTIHSEFRSKILEVNDTINWKNWTYNVGLLASRDTLYGQGLNDAPGTTSGYVLSSGTTSKARQYKMYEVPFSKMLQPRVSTTYAYNGKDTVFASFARFNPAASSLPRAASWDRNLAVTIQAYFDANGNLFAIDPLASSSGKLFVPNMTPPTHNEWLVGTARQIGSHVTARAYFRYNKGTHYWEDTNNTARLAAADGGFNPPDGIPRALYIPTLTALRQQIGQSGGLATSGSTYVIAELDGAYTSYKELTLETEYRHGKGFIRGSYTRSRYYGNFDQDNSTVTISNDGNIFIGSSNIGDGPGRQLWDFKLGTLRGDRPNAFKVYGSYFLPWHASVGTFIVAQSGQPWEKWDYTLYSALTPSTSETIKYAEPAGSRRAPSHAQMDLKYIQNLPIAKRYNAQLDVDVFNISNSQTGYNIEPRVHAAGFGQPQSFFDPRRVQVAFRFVF
ncbi:MAG TPA: carboxypeptidase regulatory-like domain-containing protein [Vicinamibacterales bacterium]|nr:carboxypeptidase regulatory-like domain-containing protein [Vicinamibacterales bacterium]